MKGILLFSIALGLTPLQSLAGMSIKKTCDVGFMDKSSGQTKSASKQGATVNDQGDRFTIYAKSGKYSYVGISPKLSVKGRDTEHPEHGAVNQDDELMRRLDDGSEFYVTTNEYRIIAINCQ